VQEPKEGECSLLVAATKLQLLETEDFVCFVVERADLRNCYIFPLVMNVQ
jgi:hypothetical protein